MTLYKFLHKVSNRVALSTDFEGGNLPGGAKDWAKHGSIEVERGGPERIGFANDHILDAIERDGFFAPVK